jgi:hypothetical protein
MRMDHRRFDVDMHQYCEKNQSYPTFVDFSVRTSNAPTNQPRPLAVVAEMFGCSVTSLIRLQVASQ